MLRQLPRKHDISSSCTVALQKLSAAPAACRTFESYAVMTRDPCASELCSSAVTRQLLNTSTSSIALLLHAFAAHMSASVNLMQVQQQASSLQCQLSHHRLAATCILQLASTSCLAAHHYPANVKAACHCWRQAELQRGPSAPLRPTQICERLTSR